MAEKFDYEKYKRMTRAAESSGNDRAVSAAKAKGRYQFLPSTWASLGMKSEDIFNPQKQEEAMYKFTMENVNYFRKKFKRDPTYDEVYGMHHLGAGGYSNVVADPNAPVSKYYNPTALAQNPHFKKYKTMGNLSNYFKLKMSSEPQDFGDDYTGVDYRDYAVTPNYTKPRLKDYTQIEGVKLQEDSSHLETINLPDPAKEVEAKKEILVNEVVEKTIQPQAQQVTQTAPQRTVQEENPTYQYLQESNLFQI